MQSILFFLYFLSLGFIFLYSLCQLSLVANVFLAKPKGKKETNLPEPLPFVTIQLPVYNEKYVIERLLECVDLIDYPKDKLEIQVLDDSTDETSELIKQKIKSLNHNFISIQRPERTGFKAGALSYGLSISKGEFVAIFDADFLPDPNFLLKTIPEFKEENVALVQSKWGHINEDYSILTKAQAFGLDAHFNVEQVGRNLKNHFINFNGTGGIWRKTAILDGGGWQEDTLTEDLDLSYRVQNNKWRFVYLPELVSPAELPITIEAIKSQQFRWTKGAAECSRKNLRGFLTNDAPVSTKIHGFFHLMNSASFVFLLLLSLLNRPLYYYLKDPSLISFTNTLTVLFQVSWVILGIFYWVSFKKSNPEKGLFNFIRNFIGFLAFMMGLSLHNTIAVIEGWVGKKSSFVRTPKFNVFNQKTFAPKNNYHKKKISIVNIGEVALLLYFLFILVQAILSLNTQIIPFYGMLTLGYGLIVYHTFKAD